MSISLEESIRFHTEEAEKLKQHKKVNEIILGTEAYERELQEHTQTAEWLRELAERRKADSCDGCCHDVNGYKCAECCRSYGDKYEAERRTE